MTAENNRRLYLAQMPKGINKLSNILMEAGSRIFLEDIFQYQQGYKYAENVRDSLLKSAEKLDKFLKYIKETPANKVFKKEDF